MPSFSAVIRMTILRTLMLLPRRIPPLAMTPKTQDLRVKRLWHSSPLSLSPVPTHATVRKAPVRASPRKALLTLVSLFVFKFKTLPECDCE